MLLVQKVCIKKFTMQSFNTLYVVGSKSLPSQLKPLVLVSIHYMLLVQRLLSFKEYKPRLVSIHYMLLVQFSIFSLIFFHYAWFQYIICCWFNCCGIKSLNFYKVSIHYMLLVQESLPKSAHKCNSFNTLYVVGSTILE